jgi:hypothetical protein
MEIKRSITTWLKGKIKEANLSSSDTHDFIKWLAVRGDHQFDLSGKKRISIEEVQSLFSWLEEKMHSAPVSEAERQQLKGWLLSRLSHHEGEE